MLIIYQFYLINLLYYFSYLSIDNYFIETGILHPELPKVLKEQKSKFYPTF